MPRRVAMDDDDSLGVDEMTRAALINLLKPHGAVGGASVGASDDSEPGSLEACEKAWLGTWALPVSKCEAALEASRAVWAGGVPAAMQACAA